MKTQQTQEKIAQKIDQLFNTTSFSAKVESKFNKIPRENSKGFDLYVSLIIDEEVTSDKSTLCEKFSSTGFSGESLLEFANFMNKKGFKFNSLNSSVFVHKSGNTSNKIQALFCEVNKN